MRFPQVKPPTPPPTPRFRAGALLLALTLLGAAPAFAQAGICKAGQLCTPTGVRVSLLGSAAVPVYSFFADANTGMYSAGADSIGFSVNGLRSFVISSASVGLLEGETSSQTLRLNTVGSRLLFGSTSVGVTTSLITLDAAAGYVDVLGNIRRSAGGASGAVTLEDPEGLNFVGVAITALSSAPAAQTFQADTTFGHFWHVESTTLANTPWVDWGGARHPAMEERTFAFYVGQESTATPTFDVAPRIGATSVTWSVVDGVAASTAVGGSAPFVRDFRASVTGAVAAPGATSTSTLINSNAWIRRDHGPRWCQWVSVSAKTSVRVWAGMTPSLPVNTDTLANDSIAFRSSSAAADANWVICSKDGTTQSCTDTTVSVATGSPGAPQLLCIDCREAGACTAFVDGVPRIRKTTNLPTSTVKMSAFAVVEALSASARTFYLGHGSIETH